jgi:glycosyltransferase involved in cell wall biosynthesis
MLSIITTTYNHRDTIARTIKSIIRQSHQDWELLIVNDGCVYDLPSILKEFTDSRIRLFTHPTNLGPNAARNTALDNVRGEWFTLLDDDDELIGDDALRTLMAVPATIDPSIDAVTCNCLDGASGEFTGFGLDHDQYLDWVTILTKCSGEFWGITKTSLLGGDRFNPQTRGLEGLLWHKIDKRARRYYIHRACRIWHTEGENRITREKVGDSAAKALIYRSYKSLFAEEREYLNDLEAYAPEVYMNTLYNAGLCFVQNNDRARSFQIFREMASHKHHFFRKCLLLAGTVAGEPLLNALGELKRILRRMVPARNQTAVS